MERWRRAWRRGIVLQLTTADPLALREALANDDPRLIQGDTTSPPAFEAKPKFKRGCSPASPVKGACLIGFCGWVNRHLETVGEVREFYNEVFATADVDVDAYAFIKWFDDAGRERMRTEMLAEVERALTERSGRTPGEDLTTEWLTVVGRLYPAGTRRRKAVAC